MYLISLASESIPFASLPLAVSFARQYMTDHGFTCYSERAWTQLQDNERYHATREDIASFNALHGSDRHREMPREAKLPYLSLTQK